MPHTTPCRRESNSIFRVFYRSITACRPFRYRHNPIKWMVFSLRARTAVIFFLFYIYFPSVLFILFISASAGGSHFRQRESKATSTHSLSFYFLPLFFLSICRDQDPSLTIRHYLSPALFVCLSFWFLSPSVANHQPRAWTRPLYIYFRCWLS